MLLFIVFTIFLTSIHLIQTTALPSSTLSLPAPPIPSTHHSAQHGLHKLPHNHAIFSPTLSLYHYHHSPNSLKRSPSLPIPCPEELPSYILDISICDRDSSAQAYLIKCHLPYGFDPSQRITEYRQLSCPNDSICVDTRHGTRAHCVKFDNFAQKSFQKFAGIVTDDTAAIAISVAESVLSAEVVVTREDLTQEEEAVRLSLQSMVRVGGWLETIWEEEEETGYHTCEGCSSLSVEGLQEGVQALQVGAEVAGGRRGNVLVVTEGGRRR